MDVIKEGDWVLLWRHGKRRYLVRVREGGEFHCNEGVIKLGELIGMEYGSSVKTHLGYEFTLVKPHVLDLLEKFRRATQVVYPKDAARIVYLSGVGPGSRVVEAGTGSGFLTAVLAYYAGPSGRVYTYDIKKEYLRLAERNLRLAGLTDNVVFKLGDVRERIEEQGVDAVVLDMPDPWNAAEQAFKSLRHGGRLVCFLPTVNQIEKTVLALRDLGFVLVHVLEVSEREYKVELGSTRPQSIGVVHTGFIVAGVKP